MSERGPKFTDPAPAVSILMPVRNAAKWLAESLDSVLAQSSRHWELIAVDDGSSDAGARILAGYALRDRRIRVAATEIHSRGIVAALNQALDLARYPLVARMDVDDVAHPERLALQAQLLDESPGLFGVGCVVEAFPAQRLTGGMCRYLAWQNSLLSPADIYRDRFVESPFIHPSLMLRRDPLCEVLGGWQDPPWAEDWDLLLRAFEAGLAFARHPRALLRWRLHDGQATRSEHRYSSECFLQARSFYLARALAPIAAAKRNIWVLGAGKTGKRLGKSLAARGVELAGFVDLDVAKIGGRVRDGRRSWPVVSYARLCAMQPRPFALSAVGAEGARERICRELESWGWRAVEDYLAAA